MRCPFPDSVVRSLSGVAAAASVTICERRLKLQRRLGVVEVIEVLTAVLDRVDRLAAHDGVRVEVRHPDMDLLFAGHQADDLGVHLAVQLVLYDARGALGQRSAKARFAERRWKSFP